MWLGESDRLNLILILIAWPQASLLNIYNLQGLRILISAYYMKDLM